MSGNSLVMVSPEKRVSEKLKKEILTDKQDQQEVKQHYQKLEQQIKQKQQAA